jgi:hypothetical protein
MAKSKYSNIYQFKISLKGISPQIWRRIQVPENYSFWNLHVAIQDSMGWWDSHLHSFVVKNPVSGEKEEIGIPSDDFFDEIPMLPGWEEKISERFTEGNKKAEYVYDFGDGWHHEVKLEKILQREENVKYPRCIAGKRACPPEDCGGVGGYYNLLEIISNPTHEEYEEMMEWLGGEYDPEAFNPVKVEFDNPEERLKNIL